MVNAGETMGQKDLYKKNENDSSTDKDEPPKKKQKGNGKKNRRVTKQRAIGSVDDTVEVKLVAQVKNICAYKI